MKLVILDRDGVINHDSRHYIKSPREWHPIPGSLDAMARLSQNGFRVVVASNQSGIGRGLFGYGDLFAIHDKLARMVGELGGRLDGMFFCPHTEEDACACRKPGIGLLEDIRRRFQTDLVGVPMVGDGLRDLQAARSAGAVPILVRTGNGAATEREAHPALAGVVVHDDLAQAVGAMIKESRKP
ncbi:MAG: D-glycero-beta-D-manno-heptose 1,7-bisphosphate 7-phosphatase [Salinisphaera sp.]|nr:D-glycero-beta-D-manno-heptose 1,7-bisphosphate 7-phosphatase [Salinisphaera sp.]